MDTRIAKSLLLAAFVGLVHAAIQPHIPSPKRVPKQINNEAAAVTDAEEDHVPQESLNAAELGGGIGSGKYFMDTIMLETGPKQIEFGHVCEDPDEWEQRYERRDEETKRYQGKARWGDKHGGYGEHYWDYNHGGHHGDDEESSDDADGDGNSPQSEFHPGQTPNDHVMSVHEKKKKRPDDTETAGTSSVSSDPSLTFDAATGFIINEATGRRYRLTPIN